MAIQDKVDAFFHIGGYEYGEIRVGAYFTVIWYKYELFTKFCFRTF